MDADRKIGNFSFLQKFQTALGHTQPPIQCAKYSTVHNAEIKNKRGYTSFPPDAFVVCVKENFTFLFRLLPLSKASYDFSRI